MYKVIPFVLILFGPKLVYGGLLGTTLSIETSYQQTSSSSIEAIGFYTTATVTDPQTEFPSLEDLEIIGAGPGGGLVDVAIDVGDSYVEIDFDNTGEHSSFASGFFNGYVLTFDNSVSVNVQEVRIDDTVTNLGLSQSDVTYSGNQLMINVEGLTFNTSSFVRIMLSIDGGPVSNKPEISVKDGFIKLDTTNGVQPNSSDCNSTVHDGRLVLDELNSLLYICTAGGWISK